MSTAECHSGQQARNAGILGDQAARRFGERAGIPASYLARIRAIQRGFREGSTVLRVNPLHLVDRRSMSSADSFGRPTRINRSVSRSPG